MQADIPIVIVAYNRPIALLRLLTSLQNADYTGYSNVKLFISIDYSGKNDCYDLAVDFNWEYGEKKVLKHDKNLGLKNHILQCGDLSLAHDAVIVLEDDLFVSPAYYDYAQQAYSFYKKDNQIAGIGLYNYKYNEVAFCPFEPLSDGFDSYFLQVPCSWGQMWTKEQWVLFKNYLDNVEEGAESDRILPDAVAAWPSETSWKKICYHYLISTNRYFVNPCISLTTNFGDRGQHHENNMMVWQTPLLLKTKKFMFSQIGDSISIYDAFFELDSKVFNKLTHINLPITIDINGSKSLSQIDTEYLISSKKCKDPIRKYAHNLYPYINNALMNIEGGNKIENYFSLGLTSNFKDELNIDLRAIDIRRIFFDARWLLEAGKNEIKRMPAFIIGVQILKPYNFVKQKLIKIINKIV